MRLVASIAGTSSANCSSTSAVFVGVRTSFMPRLQHGRQRSFGGNQQSRRIEFAIRLQQLVEGIAGRAPPVRRKIARDQIAIRLSKCQDVTQQAPTRIVRRGLRRQRLRRHLTQLGHTTGRQRRTHTDDVVSRHAIRESNAPRSSCCRSRRRWWRGCWTTDRDHTSICLALSCSIQALEIESRLGQDRSFLHIQIVDAGEVFRKIDDERRPHRLPRQRRTTTARQDRHAMTGRQLDRARSHRPSSGESPPRPVRSDSSRHRSNRASARCDRSGLRH